MVGNPEQEEHNQEGNQVVFLMDNRLLTCNQVTLRHWLRCRHQQLLCILLQLRRRWQQVDHLCLLVCRVLCMLCHLDKQCSYHQVCQGWYNKCNNSHKDLC